MGKQEWVVTYHRPGRKLSDVGLKRHRRGCQHLQPNPAKPHTGRRKLHPSELAHFEPCWVF
jgi:hypothetical protein